MKDLALISSKGLDNLNLKGKNICEQITFRFESYEELHKQYLLLLDFFNDYIKLSPILETIIKKSVEIQESEVFRNKIINKEINSLRTILKQYEVNNLNETPTEIELLKYCFNDIIVFRIKILNKIKETYSKEETTLKIKF